MTRASLPSLVVAALERRLAARRAELQATADRAIQIGRELVEPRKLFIAE